LELSLVEVLIRTQDYLKDRGSASARLDAELLMSHVLGLDRLQLYLQHDRPLIKSELAALREPVRRRGNREPIATIVGSKEFWSRDFLVRPGVLVPRPDTETLVQSALAMVPETRDKFFVVDVGCGSGCIGLTLAMERQNIRLFALDASPVALACTRENVAALALQDRVAVMRSDLMSAIPLDRPVDMVVSNPPYIPSAAIEGLAPEVSRHEPRLALDGGPDGLDFYRRLLPAAAKRARKAVLVEVGHDQAIPVMALFRQAGLKLVRTKSDLAGIDRVVIGETNP
jgi:release factor glutamine methyltransferase